MGGYVGDIDLSSQSTAGDAFSDSNSNQGGLTINRAPINAGAPKWLVGLLVGGLVVTSSAYLISKGKKGRRGKK